MKHIRFAGILIVVMMAACDHTRDDITTFILVRHAEKGNDGTEDPELTEEGRERAEKLASMFKDTPITAIYSTNYKRTRSTARPVAAHQNLEVRTYEAFKPDAIEGMIEQHRGETVFIAGHSDTTPWTANLLTGKEAYKKYSESEYGILLIVSVTEMGDASAVRINY